MSAGDERPPLMTQEEFRLLRDIIYDHCGILFREEMKYLLERRLVPRLRLRHCETFGDYHRFLRFDAGRRAELEAAVDVLTTNETYFFREPNQLRAFSEEVLPMLAEEKQRTKK